MASGVLFILAGMCRSCQTPPGRAGSKQGPSPGATEAEKNEAKPQGKFRSAKGLFPERAWSQKPRVEGGG